MAFGYRNGNGPDRPKPATSVSVKDAETRDSLRQMVAAAMGIAGIIGRCAAVS
jgi:hypothetical protein